MPRLTTRIPRTPLSIRRALRCAQVHNNYREGLINTKEYIRFQYNWKGLLPPRLTHLYRGDDNYTDVEKMTLIYIALNANGRDQNS